MSRRRRTRGTVPGHRRCMHPKNCQKYLGQGGWLFSRVHYYYCRLCGETWSTPVYFAPGG